MTRHPRLARGVTMTRRKISDEEIYYLVKEPRKGSFLRMGETEAAILRLLDGSRSPRQVIEELEIAHDTRVGEDVMEGFIAALVRRGLVESPKFDPAAFRNEWLQQQRARQLTLGRMVGSLSNFKLRLFNPHRLFVRLVGPLKFVWTRGFVVACLLLMAAATTMSLYMRDEMLASSWEFYAAATSSTGSFAAYAAILYATFFVVVAIHELAHGLTCAHFGGKVTDMGFILFYLQVPGFYCDITDAYGFERRSHRLWTTIAGGFSGLVLASLGALVWWATDPGDLINSAALALMLVGGPPLLVLNWNPLIKLDGYYILMDLLEAPNLMDNSMKHLGYLFKSRILRVPVEAPRIPRRLRLIYTIYGIAAFLFIVPLISSMPVIIYYLFEDLTGSAIALVVAIGLGYRILKRPATKAVATLRYTWLSHRSALAGAGQSGWARLPLVGTLAGLAILGLLFGPRFAVRAEGTGVLEPLERIEVRTSWPGFVPVAPGDWASIPREGDLVGQGQMLVRLENLTLEAERRAAALELEALRLDVARLQAEGQPAAAAVRRAGERSLAVRQALLEKQIQELALAAPIAGAVLTPRLEDRAGRYLEAGTTWCLLGRTDRLRVRLALTEKDLGVIGEGSLAEVKGVHLPASTFQGRVVRLPAGRPPERPSGEGLAPALMTASLVAAAPISAPGVEPPAAGAPQVSGSLEVRVEVENQGALLRPGMSARVRIYGERLTLAGHGLRWVRRLVKGKVWW